MHENITRALVEDTARKLSPQLTTALLLETYCSNSPSRDLIRPQSPDRRCCLRSSSLLWRSRRTLTRGGEGRSLQLFSGRAPSQ